MKRFSFGLLTGLLVGLLLATATFALAGQQIRLIVNGKDITDQFDVKPMIFNNRTLVPARPLAEALGARVEWDEGNRAVVVTKPANVDPGTIDPSLWISLLDLCKVIGYTPAFINDIPPTLHENQFIIETIPTDKGNIRVRAFNSRTYFNIDDLRTVGIIN
ncbi:MAG: copper amine oxidase N-terminal domain-containing protein [Peptococcaceae bacterium]|nr:MAG: copper amine oxidase N-terminal domain-containing protein [Peptococcaceae bacterium]